MIIFRILSILDFGRRRRMLAMLLVILVSACFWDGLTGPETVTIRAFAAAEGMVPVRRLDVVLRVGNPRAVVFQLEGGDPLPPHDCSFECSPWFLRLSGLWFDGRIGWLHGAADPGSLTIFDFLPEDDFLTSAKMFDALAAVDESFFEQTYKQVLVRDPDTPLTGLRRIAEGLSAWISPSIAGLLLDHPVAGRDCQVIGLIARVPAFQGDVYAEIRARAQGIRDLQC